MVKYNLKDYLELLKYDKLLKQENKSLQDEDPSKYTELISFSSKVTGFLHWCERDNYFQLLDDFLNFKIDGQQFDKLFSGKVKFIENEAQELTKNLDYQKLKYVQPSWRSVEFSEFISEIYLCCNEFYPSFTEEDRAEIPFAKTADQIRDIIINDMMNGFIRFIGNY